MHVVCACMSVCTHVCDVEDAFLSLAFDSCTTRSFLNRNGHILQDLHTQLRFFTPSAAEMH